MKLRAGPSGVPARARKPAPPAAGPMRDDTGTWDKMKGKTNDAVGGARGDLGQQLKGKGQKIVGEGKEALHDAEMRRRDRDLP